VLCFDAKISFDDNAAFRQSHIFDQADTTAEDPREVQARQHNLNYIGMDGNIGCLVNGAGLAMATMDIIKLHGGSPANFLDVGGNANTNQIFNAFRILMTDPRVLAVFVNIFGGIMRCDIIARGIIEAINAGLVSKPVVVRLCGTMAEEGMRMVEGEEIGKIRVCGDFDGAAAEAVRMACNAGRVVNRESN